MVCRVWFEKPSCAESGRENLQKTRGLTEEKFLDGEWQDGNDGKWKKNVLWLLQLKKNSTDYRNSHQKHEKYI
jgi:hypothetical protein